ncbi:hypothetical protein PPL_10254 [Heterostelium album PN500]|uniref:Uncharacterized protein n=1 Tax=Heterostelium pallidum (strain ATCC 26659 / Pp 5 / PN500) TaxID=670386 RepID=D3BQR7_HETP5|nr:hypothetical protein PPL_10254 [Heterostelium album PN500]EFA76487.1 hypothetical protein PPL_10254 [Heterostelium album PN500]|eukprot:XP_020428619.1 hypothetical protein PPL_10254 [Heterostelium album PN500]
MSKAIELNTLNKTDEIRCWYVQNNITFQWYHYFFLTNSSSFFIPMFEKEWRQLLDLVEYLSSVNVCADLFPLYQAHPKQLNNNNNNHLHSHTTSTSQSNLNNLLKKDIKPKLLSGSCQPRIQCHPISLEHLIFLCITYSINRKAAATSTTTSTTTNVYRQQTRNNDSNHDNRALKKEMV